MRLHSYEDIDVQTCVPKNAAELYGMLTATPDLCGTFTLSGEYGIDWAFSEDITITIGIGPVDGYLSVDRKLFGKILDPITHWHPEKDELYGEICRIGKRGNVLVIRKNWFWESTLYAGSVEDCPYLPERKWCFGRMWYLYAK